MTITVEVWAKGYATDEGLSRIKVPTTWTEGEIRREVRRIFPYGLIAGYIRPIITETVSEEYARAMTKGDNT